MRCLLKTNKKIYPLLENLARPGRDRSLSKAAEKQPARKFKALEETSFDVSPQAKLRKSERMGVV
jgi:hypothetical protein